MCGLVCRRRWVSGAEGARGAQRHSGAKRSPLVRCAGAAGRLGWALIRSARSAPSRRPPRCAPLGVGWRSTRPRSSG